MAATIAACGAGEPGGEQEGPDEGPAEPPSCEDVYATAAQVHNVVDVEETTGCLVGGVVMYFGLERETCTDGRTLFWNDRGYGFSGATWIDAEAGENPPLGETARCRGALEP